MAEFSIATDGSREVFAFRDLADKRGPNREQQAIENLTEFFALTPSACASRDGRWRTSQSWRWPD